MSSAMAFDALDYTKKLEKAGFTRDQAEIQAENAREMMKLQREYVDQAMKEFNETTRQNLATRGDLRETELRLQKEIKSVEYRLLLWQLGIGISIMALMAKGFHWLGF